MRKALRERFLEVFESDAAVARDAVNCPPARERLPYAQEPKSV